jgi:hypothetical protein
MNSEAEALVLVTREKRNHIKNSKNKHDAEARQARLHRKAMLTEDIEEEDWRSYVNK